jgi:hypothetical protein
MSSPSRRHSWQTRTAQIAGIGLALVGLAFIRSPKPLAARAAEPTFAEDVAPIFYKNCVGCHHVGGLAPFSLVEYDSVTNNMDEMRQAVANQVMPPWQADGEHGVFRNDRRLSDADRQTILRWIDGGAKPGDLKNLQSKPEFSSKWAIGTPDAIVSMPEEYTVAASGTIDYQYFQVPTGITEDKWVQAIEIQPGAREVVHHVIVFAYVPPQSGAANPTPPAPQPAGQPAAPRPAPLFIRNPAQSPPPDPPRLNSDHAPPRMMGTIIGTTAPGTNVVEFPKGTALRLRAGTIITFQMHYTAKGHEMHDRSSVGFKFASEPPTEEIFASQFLNGAFTIPAGQKDVAVPADIGFGQPIRIWGMLPHTHLRGTRWEYKVQQPDGSSQVVLDVPRYDFNWQTFYLFDKPLEIPAGGKLLSTAWYDNSTSNKHNPDPTKDVKWGDQTWEEMQYTGILYSIPGRKVR